MYEMNRRAISSKQHWTQGWWWWWWRWWWWLFFLKQLLSLTVSIGQSIQRHQLTLQPPSYVTSSAQPTLTQMKKSYSSSDSSSSSSRSLYRHPIYHPEPRSNHHHHHQSTVAHTAHLTLLDFIDTTAANPIMCTHTLLDTVAMADPSIHPSFHYLNIPPLWHTLVVLSIYSEHTIHMIYANVDPITVRSIGLHTIWLILLINWVFMKPSIYIGR